MANKSTLVYETQESLYEHAIQKKEAGELIVQHAYKAENYLKAAQMFEEVGDYEDAPWQAEDCRRLAEQAREDEKEKQYQLALYQMGNAKTVKGYEKAQKLFEGIAGYKDSQERAQNCASQSKNLSKKKKIKRIIKLMVGVAIIAGAVAAFQASPFPEQIAQLVGTKIEDPRFASNDTSKSEDNKVQGIALKDAQAGDQVSFGSHVWYVLERTDDELKMIMFQAEKFEEFRHTPYHTEQTDTDWEHSSLRRWLNSTFLENDFTDEEREKIQEVSVINEDNPVYGTDGGNDTRDRVYLLSGKEVEQYKDILSHIRMNIWLRTPGSTPDTASFMASTNIAMYYGYPVSDTNFYTCPVIHVSVAE